MSRWVAAARLLGVGWFIGICIILGVVGGLWIDNKFNTSPVLVIVGLILGVIIAFYGVYRMILPNINKRQNGGDS
jgi:F0F1-type ATP synthase assembly protein I